MILKKKIRNYIDQLYVYFRNKDIQHIKNNKESIIQNYRSVGEGFEFKGEKLFVSNPKKVIIGNNVHIDDNFYVISDGGLIIGHNTHVSKNVTICTESNNHKSKAIPYDNTTVYKPVIIEENVSIGMNVSILPGIRIGKGAIVEMGTVVNRDVKPFEVVGNAKVITIKNRDKNHYESLVSIGGFGGVDGKPITQTEFTSYNKTYYEQRNKPIVFILGTGRSGTVSITEFLNKHSECRAFHEHFHQVTRISSDLAHFKNKEVLSELEMILNTQSWDAKPDELLVHTDQRFWNLVPFLNSYFPNAKFIHLIREPYACIKSMYERGWFAVDEYPNLQKHDWAKYRLNGYLLGEFSKEEWTNLTALEKCTWYYFYLNYTIKNNLSQLPKEKSFKIDLEIFDDYIDQLLNFCGLEIQLMEIDKKNQNTKRKTNITGDDNLLSLIEKYKKKYSKIKKTIG